MCRLIFYWEMIFKKVTLIYRLKKLGCTNLDTKWYNEGVYTGKFDSVKMYNVKHTIADIVPEKIVQFVLLLHRQDVSYLKLLFEHNYDSY